ncbi:MAG: ABC transporter permease [Actinobacteria bacterium]|nr:ABC transporter permease [Actinomycetota bacterium]
MDSVKKSFAFRLTVAWFALIIFFAVFGPLLPLPNWQEVFDDALSVTPLKQGHLLGTDSNGYDILSGIVYGARISLFISFTAVFLGGVIGSAIGISAAYVRGKYDYVVSTLFNVVLSVPNLVLSLALIAVLATNVDPNVPTSTGRRITVLVISLTIVIIPILGRIARAATLSWANREFVLAARSMGSKDRNIIWRHIVPNVLPAIFAVAFLAIGVVIVAEASLSLLGAGVPDGTSWGSMVARGRNDIEFAPHIIIIPLIFIALTVISCNYIGDVIRKQLDQRQAKL